MGDHALFLQDGERHRQIKRVMTRRSAMKVWRTRLATSATSPAEAMSTTGRSIESLAVRPLMHELRLRVLMKIVFGAREAGRRARRRLVQDGSLARPAAVEALDEPESPSTPASRPDLERARIPPGIPANPTASRPARPPPGVPI